MEEEKESAFWGDYNKENTKCINNMYIYASCLANFFDEWARNNNMNPTQMKILHGLSCGDCKKQRDIVKKYNLPRTTVNSIVGDMIKTSLLVMNSKNKILTLTDKGIQETQKIQNFFNKLILQTEQKHNKNPKEIFKHFNTYSNIIIGTFTEKAKQNKKAHA